MNLITLNDNNKMPQLGFGINRYSKIGYTFKNSKDGRTGPDPDTADF